VAWAEDVTQRGFQILGPTVVYAHRQAVGMVNDHTVDCFRRFARRTSLTSERGPIGHGPH
jgi:3-methyladenine DNA glycosylase Tag